MGGFVFDFVAEVLGSSDRGLGRSMLVSPTSGIVTFPALRLSAGGSGKRARA